MQCRQVAERLQEVIRTTERLVDCQVESIKDLCEAVISVLARGHKLLLFGNGGSAATAQHLAAEFVGRFRRERRPWPALALTTDTSAVTAIANDYSFDMVFARQIRALGCRGDAAMAISTSGGSPNVLNGIEIATEIGITTIALTGGDGGPLAKSVDIPIIVPSVDTPRIQECHLAIGHIVCDAVELALSGDTPNGAHFPVSRCRPIIATAGKLMEWPELLRLREEWRCEGKRVVWTNGCFDLLHAGHLHSLFAAREFGDVLVVGLNGDESVRRLKGHARPIVPAAERAELVAALECVDAVTIFEALTPEVALGRLKPDVHCKGAEYAAGDVNVVPEAQVVAAYGGQVAFLPMLANHSTTEIIERIHQSAADT